MDAPETRYAKNGDIHIAYQVLGEGPPDLLLLLGAFGHVEDVWGHPLATHFLARLSRFARLIVMDMRGTGLSDGIQERSTFEEQMDDVRAVQDAVGSEGSAVFAVSQGGPVAILFAATYPERTAALILYAGFARLAYSTDYPWGRPPEFLEAMYRLTEEGWGTGVTLPLVAPSMLHDDAFRRWYARGERAGLGPGAMVAWLRLQSQIDVREVLSTIQVPTLVLHRSGDAFRDPGHSRYIAERIPRARYVVVPGDDHLPFVGDQDALLDEVEEFLTGVRPVPERDRVLATVLFTDIVDSTKRAAELGDRRWREFLAEHDGTVRRELSTYRGREIKTTGDGFLATFDGPARGISCATAIRDEVRKRDLEIRAGLHTGEIELMGEDVGGIGVHLASRVMSEAHPGEVLVSSTVKDLVVGSGIEFEDRGAHELKGVPGQWRLYSVIG